LRFRSEWLTVLILTGLGFCALAMPRHATQPIVARARVPQDGIDYMPIGSAHPTHPLKQRRQLPHN
jgi:hypothetical protein